LKFAARLAPQLLRARQTVEAAKAEAAARRAKLVLKPADKTDAAGQMRRLWKLDKLAKMSDSERNSYIAETIDHLDPELVQGILEVPEFSGVLPSDLERLRDRALRGQHGDEAIAELHELETGIAIADDVVTKAREEIARDVGGEQVFAEASKPYVRAMNAPWLKKFYENGAEHIRTFKVVKDSIGQSGRWVDPTPEELEQGVYFSTAAEWRAAQASDAVPTMERTNRAAAG
jgi:hypothetical protein